MHRSSVWLDRIVLVHSSHSTTGMRPMLSLPKLTCQVGPLRPQLQGLVHRVPRRHFEVAPVSSPCLVLRVPQWRM